jgi:hypothetical protein
VCISENQTTWRLAPAKSSGVQTMQFVTCKYCYVVTVVSLILKPCTYVKSERPYRFATQYTHNDAHYSNDYTWTIHTLSKNHNNSSIIHDLSFCVNFHKRSFKLCINFASNRINMHKLAKNLNACIMHETCHAQSCTIAHSESH